MTTLLPPLLVTIVDFFSEEDVELSGGEGLEVSVPVELDGVVELPQLPQAARLRPTKAKIINFIIVCVLPVRKM